MQYLVSSIHPIVRFSCTCGELMLLVYVNAHLARGMVWD